MVCCSSGEKSVAADKSGRGSQGARFQPERPPWRETEGDSLEAAVREDSTPARETECVPAGTRLA